MSATGRPVAGRITMWLLVPLTLALNVWMLAGPGLYGIAGWLTILVLFVVTPVLLVWQLVVMLMVLITPHRPRGFTLLQTLTVWVLWLCMAVYGATVIDQGDNPDPGVSVLMHLAGHDTRSLSGSLAWFAFLGGLAATIALVIELLVTRARAPRFVDG